MEDYGSMVMQYLMQKGYKGNIRNIGIEDQFVEHGSISETAEHAEK